MAGRILTLQRQVRELGRLRAGITVDPGNGSRPYPRASKTWIVTSQNRTYIEAAAELWGGQAEAWQPLGNRPQEWRVITQRPIVDAILPPGDPISQAYEMWTGGGCQRRCDGETEARSQEACLCRAQFGDAFHELPLLGSDKRPQRCSINTRLSVFLPELPDIGIWRVETHGYWPSVHITGYVETIKGLVGEQVMVPVTLAIDPKTKVRDGKTSQYVEIVVALKERASFGQIIAAPETLAIGGPTDARTIEAAPERTAIGAAPAEQPAATEVEAGGDLSDWHKLIDATDTVEGLREVWKALAERKVNDKALKDRWWARKKALDEAAKANPAASTEAPETPPRGEPTTEPLDAEQEPDRQAAWTQALALAAERDWKTADTSRRFREYVGKDVVDATGWEIEAFADAVKNRQVQ